LVRPRYATRRAKRPRDAAAMVTHLVCMVVDIMAAIVARVPIRKESGACEVRTEESPSALFTLHFSAAAVAPNSDRRVITRRESAFSFHRLIHRSSREKIKKVRKESKETVRKKCEKANS